MTKQYNYAVAVLRIMACYAVVSVHFGPMLPFSGWAVPIFMLLAFYFSPEAITGEWRACVRRLKRLAIPYFVWGGIGVLMRWCGERDINLSWLYMQVFSGMSGNSVLYFIFLCALNTVILWSVFRGRRPWCVLSVLWVIMFGLQYSGLNLVAWDWLPLHMKVAYGKLVELLPYAITGLWLRLNCRDGRNQMLAGVALVVFYTVLHDYDHIAGFCCQGFIEYLGVTGLCACVITLGISWNVKTAPWSVLLMKFASLTPGIFYIHKLVGIPLLKLFTGLHGYVSTFVVFVVSLVVCVMLTLNSRLKVLIR